MLEDERLQTNTRNRKKINDFVIFPPMVVEIKNDVFLRIENA